MILTIVVGSPVRLEKMVSVRYQSREGRISKCDVLFSGELRFMEGTDRD